MTSGHFGRTGTWVAVCAVTLIAACAVCWAQPATPAGSVVVRGHVRDSRGRPVKNATVSLQPSSGTQALATPVQTTYTDTEGAYRFAALRGSAYTLHAKLKGAGEASFGPVTLTEKQTRTIDLVFGLPDPSQKPAAQAPEFFDEPQFTVAGVTQATNSGGHGPDTVLRTTEALAKATVSLSKEANGGSNPPTATAADESTLRDETARSPKDPSLHHLLGDLEEKLGNPLEAVREYQRAAELDPSEPNLFDWGAELLTHHALEPATEVFARGNHLFPRSVRMLVALGVAWYARGSYDQATRCLVNASDLATDNPTPYLFLGRMQDVEATPSEGSAQTLARFAQLQPDNALANYFYAVSLWKQSASAPSPAQSAELSSLVESSLMKAVRLDPKLGEAYLRLGIFYAQRADFSRAISAYQKAIEVSREEVSPQIDQTLQESHYRLAQAYLRMGDKTAAQEELQLYSQITQKTKEDTEHERRTFQEFVISLRSQNSASPPQP